MRVTSPSPLWKRSVRVMRILCPIGALLNGASLTLHLVAGHDWFVVAIPGFGLLLCLFLTWMNWRKFEV